VIGPHSVAGIDMTRRDPGPTARPKFGERQSFPWSCLGSIKTPRAASVRDQPDTLPGRSPRRACSSEESPGLQAGRREHPPALFAAALAHVWS
jgi:hypothetical protein